MYDAMIGEILARRREQLVTHPSEKRPQILEGESGAIMLPPSVQNSHRVMSVQIGIIVLCSGNNAPMYGRVDEK